MTSQRGCGSGEGWSEGRAGAVLGLTLVALFAAGCPVRVQTTYADAGSGGKGSGGKASGGETGDGGDAASGGQGGGTGGGAAGQGGNTGSGGIAGTGGATVGGTGGMAGCPPCVAPTSMCDMTSRKCVGCLSSANCAAPTPVCDTMESQRCVGCLSNANCSGATPVCDTMGSRTCVGCLSNANCSGATPVCDLTSHTCVGCLQNSQCMATSTKPICDAMTKTCTGCMTRNQCMIATSMTPACRSDGSCVQCTVPMDCAGMMATPVCSTSEGKCVGCLADSDCSGAKPICDTASRSCVACSQNSQCMTKNPLTPGCVTAAGNNKGTCVACTEHAHCPTTAKPVCVANVCSACTSDAQCVAKSPVGPGVCMFHTDGHCATDAEVLYVKPASGCDDNGSGTVLAPFCAPQRAIAATTATKNVVVIRKGTAQLANWSFAGTTPISVIGQGGASVGGAMVGSVAGIGIQVTSGTVYVRNLGVSGMLGVGVAVSTGATLKMDGCIVTLNQGGLSVNGGGFEINNSVFADNGAATAPVAFGGVYLKQGVGAPAQFRNNTIYNNAGPGLVCDGTYPVRGLFVANNTGTQVTMCDFADNSSVVAGATVNAYFDTTPGRPYRQTAMSPCVDLGHITDFSPRDIDGNPRPSPANGRSDCGAHELQK